MKLHIWHYSALFVLITVIGIILLAGIGAGVISALLFLCAWPAGLIWFGWTLKMRQMYIKKTADKRALDRVRELRKQGIVDV